MISRFYRIDFEVTRDVLRPYQTTEKLVDAALGCLRDVSQPHILDVGCGCGNIAISILLNREDARCVATDISHAAIEVANRNAYRHGVADRFSAVESASLVSLSADKEFDLIVCNPPYLTADDLREINIADPMAALTDGAEGLSLSRDLIAQTPSYLKPGGCLLLECKPSQKAQLWLKARHAFDYAAPDDSEVLLLKLRTFAMLRDVANSVRFHPRIQYGVESEQG